MSTEAATDGASDPGRPAVEHTTVRVGIAERTAGWRRRLRIQVVLADLAAVLLVLAVGRLLGFGHHSMDLGPGPAVPTDLVASGLVLLFLLLLRCWDPDVLGHGSEEFARVLRATFAAVVALGLIGLATVSMGVRPWVFGLVPLAGLLLVVGRWLVRRVLHARRRDGRCLTTVLAVGSRSAVEDLVARTRRDRHIGWHVAGVCLPEGAAATTTVGGVPVVGDLDSVAGLVRGGGFDMVSVGSAPGLTGRRLHQLAWDLEDAGSGLVVDPGLMEIAGPRLHVTPIDGLPLLRLTRPTLTGASRLVKKVIDVAGAAVILVLVAPVLLGAAIAVASDGGPVFFRQERVGRGGKTFRMLKFRSMVVDAEARRAALMAEDEGAGPLFKMREDPRITRVGRTMRRYSLDELPQLINVLTGSMSLVGPRPPLPEEVARYSRAALRKLVVKPGLTGLWQVSGRSNLSWEESVRLDLRYVENWTLMQDAQILWKTVGAVVGKSGAY